MKIRINVKGAGRRAGRLTQIEYDYPLSEMTVGEFLTETARQTVRDYNARGKEKTPDGEELLMLFSDSSLKIVHTADEGKAVRDVLQAFEDGIVAVFVDGVRYTETAQRVTLTPKSEATFMRLTFLAGRIW